MIRVYRSMWRMLNRRQKQMAVAFLAVYIVALDFIPRPPEVRAVAAVGALLLAGAVWLIDRRRRVDREVDVV
jgi:hypothetical protein